MRRNFIWNVGLWAALAGGVDLGLTAERGQTKNPPSAGDARFSTPGRGMVVGLTKRRGQAPLRIEAVSRPKHGRIEVRSARGNVRYVPPEGFAGTDTFTYRVIDSRGVASEPATVTIEVTPRGERDYSSGIRFDPPPHLEKIETTRPIFRVHDSQNIAIFSSGAMRNHCVGYPGVGESAYYWVTGRSKNVLFANLNPQNCGRGEGSFTLLESTSHGRAAAGYPEMVAVYKRGKLDDEGVVGTESVDAGMGQDVEAR